MRLAIGLGIVLLAATTLAQDGVFVDKRNNMSVKNWTSFVIHRVSDSLVEFKGEGKPLQAEWAGQRIELRTNSLSGSASVQAEGLLTLISADLQGAVWARQKLPSAQGASASNPWRSKQDRRRTSPSRLPGHLSPRSRSGSPTQQRGFRFRPRAIQDPPRSPRPTQSSLRDSE